jgi:poly-beta-1,6-N-acetyl-D-glucosamine synthase
MEERMRTASQSVETREGSSPGPQTSRKYVLITPCRDEAAFLVRTIGSIAAQSVRPTRWVIVDDGSRDATPEILAEAMRRHPFIDVVRREDRGARSVGPGVIDAFYAGLSQVDLDQCDFICKLDGDLDLPPSYFEALMRRMEGDPRLGTCSGKAYYVDKSTKRLVSEGIGDDVSIGAAKFYRVECFREIGGFVRQVMWDGIDCHRCRMLGWKAMSFDDPEVRFIHLRPMGSSHKGIWTGRMRHGAGQYFMGTGLEYMTASSLFRMTHPPIVLGGLAMWLGYVKAAVRRQPRYEDLDFRRFLRRYQRDALLRGKRTAVIRAEAAGGRRAGATGKRPVLAEATGC